MKKVEQHSNYLARAYTSKCETSRKSGILGNYNPGVLLGNRVKPVFTTCQTLHSSGRHYTFRNNRNQDHQLFNETFIHTVGEMWVKV